MLYSLHLFHVLIFHDFIELTQADDTLLLDHDSKWKQDIREVMVITNHEN